MMQAWFVVALIYVSAALYYRVRSLMHRAEGTSVVDVLFRPLPRYADYTEVGWKYVVKSIGLSLLFVVSWLAVHVIWG